MCIRLRPNLFGPSLGRKFGVLYDDYVKGRFVSARAINKKEEEVVLHTQEAWGSSPYAPTIFFNNLAGLTILPDPKIVQNDVQIERLSFWQAVVFFPEIFALIFRRLAG
jgi:hypothetical protein